MDAEPGQREARAREDDAGGAAARPGRWLWFAAAWAFLALGIVGAVLPVLPTTPFLLLALWAFSRSSSRFHHWLYHHRLFGPPLQRWRVERVIPMRVKAIAAVSMLASLGYVAIVMRPDWYVAAAAAALVVAGLGFLARVPSRRAPGGAPGSGAPAGDP